MGWQGQAGCVARVDKLYPEREILLVSRLLLASGKQRLALCQFHIIIFLLVQ